MSVPVTQLIIKASIFARKAHEGQMRKYSGLPYIQHPARVAGEVAVLPDATEEMVAAAWLHDTIEDTASTLEEVRKQFGDSVADLVDWLTNTTKIAGETRAVHKAKTFARLAGAPREAKRIKMLDRIDNLSETDPGDPKHVAFARLYATESRALLKEIGDADEHLAIQLMDAVVALEKRIPVRKK